jgi:hypothetical protein
MPEKRDKRRGRVCNGGQGRQKRRCGNSKRAAPKIDSDKLRRTVYASRLSIGSAKTREKK